MTGVTLSDELRAELERIAEPNGNAPKLRAVALDERPSTTWATVDLGPVLAGDQIDEPPAYLARTDGARLVYSGKTHIFQGEPESGKGWLALVTCRERVAAGEHVLYIDFEDGPATAVGRLLALGLSPDAIAERFHYIRPDEPLGEVGRLALDAALLIGPTAIVIDGVTEALTMHGLKLEDNTDIAKWLALLPRPLAATGAAVIQIDHVVKRKDERGRYALGGQHKLAGVDVSYSLDVIEPLGRGRRGLVKVTVAKDRPGYVRQLGDGKSAAEMHVESHDDGSVTVELRAPLSAGADGFRPTHLMERISRAIEREPGITKGALRKDVKGNSDAKDRALEVLLSEGYARIEADGQAHRHHSVLLYREADDEGSEA